MCCSLKGLFIERRRDTQKTCWGGGEKQEKDGCHGRRGLARRGRQVIEIRCVEGRLSKQAHIWSEATQLFWTSLIMHVCSYMRLPSEDQFCVCVCVCL